MLIGAEAHTQGAVAAAPAFAPARRSQVFIYEDGFLFCCEGMATPRTERFTGTLLIATTDADIELDIDGQRQQLGAVMLKPFTPKVLRAEHTPFVSMAVNPNHPKYRAYARIAAPGFVAVPRSLFRALHPQLHKLRAGQLSLGESRKLFNQCVDLVTGLLPPLRPIDPRIERVMAELRRDHRQQLGALAQTTCLSYYRLSHLFSKEMGMSLRQYTLSAKIHAACRCIGAGMSLTATAHEAGFTDSAHLSRVWAKAFGGPPSHFLDQREYALQPPLNPA